MSSQARKKRGIAEKAASSETFKEIHNGGKLSSQSPCYKTDKVLQIETLDTYLKLLLQVLVLRSIASLLFATIKLLFTSDACKSQEWQRKPFSLYICCVKADRCQRASPELFCKSKTSKAIGSKALGEFFFPPLLFLDDSGREKKKDCR